MDPVFLDNIRFRRSKLMDKSSSNEVSGNRKNPGYRVKEEAEMGIENEACVKEEMGLDSEKQLFPKTDEPSITMKEETKERRSL
ncbi:hypothetical protein D5086_016884 [Populus alba]|uniref:Uncharacterized protein n=1 Tax=Populus alba TaxID=43335 RepID=A0ACC4BVE7_POPAL